MHPDATLEVPEPRALMDDVRVLRHRCASMGQGGGHGVGNAHLRGEVGPSLGRRAELGREGVRAVGNAQVASPARSEEKTGGV